MAVCIQPYVCCDHGCKNELTVQGRVLDFICGFHIFYFLFLVVLGFMLARQVLNNLSHAPQLIFALVIFQIES
jgi:hypothetical protein